jgi:hypothetical protein
MKNFIKSIIKKFKKWKKDREFKKKLEEIRKRDPFIYKH